MLPCIFMETHQGSCPAGYSYKVQRDSICYCYAAFFTTFCVIQCKILFSGGSIRKTIDKVVHYAI